jgi:hypothetical protein
MHLPNVCLIGPTISNVTDVWHYHAMHRERSVILIELAMTAGSQTIDYRLTKDRVLEGARHKDVDWVPRRVVKPVRFL